MCQLICRWLACVLCCAAAAAGGAEPRPNGPNAPLAALPSAPEPHLEKVKALGDGQWLNLGKPAPDPKWGAAPGRSYTCKMAAAPDLGGAFLYGEGVHGGTRDVNGQEYYNDDLFFYDLNAHAWICCYPGTKTKGLKLRYSPDLKCEVDENGDPVPVTVMVHGYSDIAYSVKRGVFACLPNGSYFWEKPLGHYRKWPDVEVIHRHGPWLYDAKTGKWEFRTDKGCPPPTFGGVLEFVSRGDKEQLFRYTSDGAAWFYDLDERRWSEANLDGPRPPWGIEPNACYDIRRGRLYMGGGQYPEAADANALWAYDIKENALIDLKAKGSKISVYATWGAVMTYDSANDKVVVTRYNPYKGEPTGVFVYDPEANAWGEPQPLPEGVEWKQVNGFYDVATNAHYYHNAGDSEPSGEVLVYRLKAAPAAE